MNTNNFTEQELIRFARECIIKDEFMSFSTLILGCRRRDGTSPNEVLQDIERAILRDGTESEHDKFRQFRENVDGAADELADITGISKREVMSSE